MRCFQALGVCLLYRDVSRWLTCERFAARAWSRGREGQLLVRRTNGALSPIHLSLAFLLPACAAMALLQCGLQFGAARCSALLDDKHLPGLEATVGWVCHPRYPRGEGGQSGKHRVFWAAVAVCH